MLDQKVIITDSFKSQTRKAILALIFFAFIYLTIFTIALVFAGACIIGSAMLVAFSFSIFSIAIGIGAGGLGVLILIFLFKFIFKSNKIDRSHLIEIKNFDEPELFLLIEDVVKKVDTNFPKKVYLSADVNASVFYDSNFWSMFLPIQKNLQLGIGLVNTLSKEELKAVLAHEFGHFSQKTMKVGSYVYNINRIIFNLLYENESYEKIMRQWAELSGYFSFFVIIANNIVKGIQWVLRKLYNVVNKSYLGLSREMEFHADEIAASVTGFEPLKNALLRMQLADFSFNIVLNYYEHKIKLNTKSENVFNEQLLVMNFYAKESNMRMINGLPEINQEEINRFNKSKLVIKDQWASHPSLKERIERLEQCKKSDGQLKDILANEVFKDINETQKKLSSIIFKDVNFEEVAQYSSISTFETEFTEEYRKNEFPKIYRGYYDDKNPLEFDLSRAVSKDTEFNLSNLFSDEKIDMVYTAFSMHYDLEILKQIADKVIQVKSFDYDGKKYKVKNCKTLIPYLSEKLGNLQDLVKENDFYIYSYFKNCEKEKNNEFILENLYSNFFRFDKSYSSKMEIYTKLSNDLQFVHYTLPIEEINHNFFKLESLERQLKGEIKYLLMESKIQPEITTEMRENFESYLKQDLKYFGTEIYLETNLTILFHAMNNYAFLLSRYYFLMKLEILKYQESLLEN